MRKVFAAVAVLFALAGVLQLYFAAIGVFSQPEDDLFAIHGANGRMVMPILAILTIVFAALARAGKRTVWLSVIAFVLLIFQTLLFIIIGAIFNVGPESAEVPLGATLMLGLHGVNGLAVLALAGVVAGRAIRLARTPVHARRSGTTANQPVAATQNATTR